MMRFRRALISILFLSTSGIASLTLRPSLSESQEPESTTSRRPFPARIAFDLQNAGTADHLSYRQDTQVGPEGGAPKPGGAVDIAQFGRLKSWRGP